MGIPDAALRDMGEDHSVNVVQLERGETTCHEHYKTQREWNQDMEPCNAILFYPLQHKFVVTQFLRQKPDYTTNKTQDECIKTISWLAFSYFANMQHTTLNLTNFKFMIPILSRDDVRHFKNACTHSEYRPLTYMLYSTIIQS